jgi:hypothetical protein
MNTRRVHASNAERQAAYRRRVRQSQETLRSNKGLPSLPTVPNVAGWARWKKAVCQV